MKIKTSFTKKVLSLFLAITIILGVIPTFTITADSHSLEYKADPATISQWHNWFPDESNRYSGGIFLDKTVYTGTDAVKSDSYFYDIADKLTFGTDSYGNNNFLVSLSAIGSNTEILGYSATPTDTMLVLDVSDSMSGDNASAMVDSTNRAIEELLSLNLHNRVGVVLYSGNSSHGSSSTGTGTVILPLGRYTTTITERVNEGTRNNPVWVDRDVFLTHSNDTVSVAFTRVNNGSNRNPNWQYTGGVKAEGSNDYIIASKGVTGGTYIQNGLSLAYNAFPSGDDTVIPDGQIQAGTQRLPIIVLMSDGAPTTATTSYEAVGTSNAGSGATSDATASVGFLTQATASWVKANLKTKYNGEEPKFYTLGLGTSNSATATGVLNPESVVNNAASLWTDFLGTNKKVNLTLPVTSNSNNTYSTTVSQADNTILNKNYVDEYWAADDADDMTAAFEAIVEEIIIQSRYYATLVTTNNHEVDGFISFTDEIGAYMEVKDIKGIHIGEGTLVTGDMFAEYALTNKFIDTDGNLTELGTELMEALKTRFGVDNTQAYQLVNNAISNGYIAWDSATKEFSNYVAWYADEDNKFIQPYNALVKTSAPDNAKYLVKSYIYLGDVTQNHVETSMLYTLVRVREDLSTGVQIVDANLPAALLPMVTYTISVEGETLNQESIISMTNNADEKAPACLLYEVGLKDDITPYNIAEKIPAGYPKNDDGTYSLYSNRWKVDADTPFPMPVDENIPTGIYSHELVGTTDAHFIPSLQNERYYYTTNTTILEKDGENYTAYTGTTKPSGEGYYHAFTWVEIENNQPKLTTTYNPITAKAVSDAKAGENNTWVIPAGTPKRYFGETDHNGTVAHTDKDPNTTETLGWSLFPASIYETGGNAQGYHVYGYLGNNGKITVEPAQGIKLTKNVSETVTGAENSFKFIITLTANNLSSIYPYHLETADGTVKDGTLDVNSTSTGGTIEVTIGAGDVIYITDLPEGTQYSVSEEYISEYVGVSSNATGTIAKYTLNSVDFVNNPRGFGSLLVEKDVTHPFDDTAIPEALTSKAFDIQVEFSGNANDLQNITNNQNITSSDGNKTFEFTLTDGMDILFTNIPEGITYTVTERNIPTGFTLVTDADDLTGAIANNTQSEALVVNKYEPQSVSPNVTLTGTKTLNPWTEGEFQVALQPVNIGGSDKTNSGDSIIIGTMKKDGPTYTFDMSDNFTYDEVGTYSYEIFEYEPTTGKVPNVAYDKRFGLFTITVTDNDIDGKLEISNVTVHRESATLTGNSTNGWTITKDFINLFEAETVTFNVQKTINGEATDHEHDSGILFGLFDSTDDVGTSAVPEFYALTNDDGVAVFGINILKDDFTTPKTYYLREIPPLLENRVVGMTYNTEWQYKVTIDWSGEEPVVTYTDMNNQPVSSTELKINNTYDTSDAYPEITFSGTKTLDGRDIKTNEFTFNIYETNADFAVATNATPLQSVNNTGTAKNEIKFDAIEFTSTGTKYYVISETKGTAGGITYDDALYHITVNIEKTVDANNKTVLEIASSYIHKVGVGNVTANAINFSNTYTIDDLEEVVIKGTKSLEGRTLIAGEFEFGLYEQGSNTPIETVKNVGDSTFTFSALKFTEPTAQPKVYEVKEIIPAEKYGVDYDPNIFTVTVNITDDGQGKLNKEVKVNGQNYTDSYILFENTYTAADSDPLTISGTKTLENRDLINGEFTFKLYETAADFLLTENQQPKATKQISKTANRTGEYEFILNYTSADVGTHYYVVSEHIPTDRYGVSYDAREYNITVMVLDNGLGKIIASVVSIVCPGMVGDFNTDELNFTNSYNSAPAEYVIKGSKDLKDKDIEANMFEFELWNSEGVIATAQNDADGNFTFPAVELGSVGAHTFFVKEINGGSTIKGIYYDDSVYTVNIEVVDNGLGNLIIEDPETDITYSIGTEETEEIAFKNSYSATATDAIKIDGKKTLNNRELESEEFEFELYESDKDGNLKGDAISTAKNTEDTSFKFDKEITFDKADDYYYAVVEKDTGAERITYDNTVFLVKVVVKDDGEGKLYVDSITYTADGKAAEGIEFVNTFTPKPEDLEIELTAKKTVKNIGSEKIGPENFEFVLENTNERKKIKVKSDKDGLAVFDITFTENDIGKTYKYKLYETNDKRENVTYSKAQYDIEIKISLNADNKLVADIISNEESVEEVVAEFENVYDYTPPTPTPTPDPEPTPEPEPTPDPAPEVPKSPQTGDTNNFSMWLALLFVSGLGIIGKSLFEVKED